LFSLNYNIPICSIGDGDLFLDFCYPKGASRMSRAAKLTLAGSSLFAVSTIFFVHFQQKAEKAVSTSPIPSPLLPLLGQQLIGVKAMHAGVIRDVEQQRIKRERQADFEMQRALEEEYKKVQTVHDGDEVLDKPR
jgi:protein PET117